jgi:HlyD family secretion protein
VSQVRLSPQMVQNVVTYTAVIDVDNPDLKLKPGMTASVTATVEEQKDVLTVPASALRFRPADAQASRPRPGMGTVYRINGEILEPVQIRTGLSNGVVTQVVSGDLNEGDAIAVAAQQAAGANRQARPAGMPGMGAPRGAGRIR